MPTQERRFLTTSTLRAEQRSDGRRMLRGRAIAYDAISQNLGGFKEKIARGACARCLKTSDLRMLFDHDAGRLLGRQSSGTLSVRDGAGGLDFECDLPDTPDGQMVFELCQRRDISGTSFGFYVVSDAWSREPDPDACDEDDPDCLIDIRTVLEMNLLEISAVAFPSYSQTSVEAMARTLWPAGIPAELRFRMQGGGDVNPDALRQRAEAAASSVISEDEAAERLRARCKAAALEFLL